MKEIITAIALSLYAYNVSPTIRAKKLYEHFDGACMDHEEIEDILIKRGAYAATELPYPTAKVYVQNAMDRYGTEAEIRATAEENVMTWLGK